MKLSTPHQVLQYKMLLVDGLARLCNHGMPLHPCRGATVEVEFGAKLGEIVGMIGGLGTVQAGDAIAASSTAAGKGIVAVKGGAPAEFVVTAVDAKGAAIRGGGDAVHLVFRGYVDTSLQVAPAYAGSRKKAERARRMRTKQVYVLGQLQEKSDEGKSIGEIDCKWNVRDNGDGTYTCAFTVAETYAAPEAAAGATVVGKTPQMMPNGMARMPNDQFIPAARMQQPMRNQQQAAMVQQHRMQQIQQQQRMQMMPQHVGDAGDADGPESAPNTPSRFASNVERVDICGQ